RDESERLPWSRETVGSAEPPHLAASRKGRLASPPAVGVRWPHPALLAKASTPPAFWRQERQMRIYAVSWLAAKPNSWLAGEYSYPSIADWSEVAGVVAFFGETIPPLRAIQ